MSPHRHPDHQSSPIQDPSRRDAPGQASAGRGFWRAKSGLVAIGFFLIAAFLLLSEHRAHALGLLPYVLILACPVLHLFMHGGHAGHGGHRGHGKPPSRPSA